MGSAGGGDGVPGLFWSQTDMFRFEMSRAGSVTEKEKVEGGGDKAGEASKSGPETSLSFLSLYPSVRRG